MRRHIDNHINMARVETASHMRSLTQITPGLDHPTAFIRGWPMKGPAGQIQRGPGLASTTNMSCSHSNRAGSQVSPNRASKIEDSPRVNVGHFVWNPTWLLVKGLRDWGASASRHRALRGRNGPKLAVETKGSG